MEKQRVREHLGALEEQLELLGSVARRNENFTIGSEQAFSFEQNLVSEVAFERLKDVHQALHEQTLQKSVATQDFLPRVIRLLIQEARAQGYEVAISYYGEGRISLEMVEISMGAIAACFRASLKSYLGMGKAVRMKHRLFPTFSFYLEALATSDEFRFRLIDDGQGYAGSFRTEFETEKQFQKVRSHIAQWGGWFSRNSLKEYGGVIEFKVPFPKGRFDSFILKSGETQILLPSACVVEIRENAPTSSLREDASVNIATLSATSGLQLLEANTSSEAHPRAVKVGMADFQFWVVCESISEKVKTRKLEGGELLSPDSWFKFFGVFFEGELARTLPLLEGEALMTFFNFWGGKK